MPHDAQLDWLVLTAANEAQARAYRAELAEREADGALPAGVRWMVVPDAGDRRIGSGLSTLLVLRRLAETLGEGAPNASIATRFAGRRVLIVHSGGDSRRLVPFAATGKVFAPLPATNASGRLVSMFDLILDDLLRLRTPPEGHVMVAVGDVMLGIGSNEIDWSRPGVTGVGVPDTLERGSRHGVYVRARNGRAADVLQKPTPTESKRRSAIVRGRVLVDTGLVGLDPKTVEAWLRRTTTLVDAILRSDLPIDLYQHVIPPLGERVTLDRFLEMSVPATSRHTKLLTRLHAALRGTPLSIETVPHCDFLHIGTTREMLALLGSATSRRTLGLERGIETLTKVAPPRSATVYSCALGGTLRARGRVIVTRCETKAQIRCGGDAIVVGVPPQVRTAIDLPRQTGVVCVPIDRREWAAVYFGADDDFKTAVDAGGTLLGRPLESWIEAIGDGDHFDGDERSAWTMRLWRVGPIERVLAAQQWMLDPRGTPTQAWRRGERRSLAELLPQVDHARLSESARSIRRAVHLATGAERLGSTPTLPARLVTGDIERTADAKRMIDSLGRSARRAKPFTAARLVAASAELAERFPRAGTAGGAELRDDALALVGDAVASQVEAAPPARAAVQRDQAVWVSSPVRLDLAGGWSDTPPICNEHGGTVLNAAVALHGADPVQVVVKVTDEPAIALHSVDLGLAETITTSAALHEHRDPRQWTSLLKAALVLSGFAPRTPRASLRRFLERFGGGLTLSAFSAVPKGSGLGTSSILGAAVLACLDRVAGRPMDRRSLIDRTSVLEQMIATRGGWQDQVGGIVGGIKISRTTPGAAQHPVTETIDVDEATMTRLARRTVLFYTGQRRMARDILQTVVGRYLVRDRAVADAIPRLKAGAESMRDALVSGDVDAFGVELLRYWRLKCTVDPNATNPAIEAMIGRLRADLAAWELPGAGGGGFLFMLANDDDAAARIRRRLERSPPNASARVFDFEVEPAGMKVTVL